MARKRSDAEQLLRRLENGGLESLATLTIDHVLARPVAELVDPNWVARQVVLALEAVSAGPETEQWLAKRITDRRETVPAGTVGDRMPDEIRRPLRDVVGKPYLPDRVLVGRLLDHAAMQRLLRDVLVGALRGFVAKLKAPVPRPLSKLRALGGKALQEGMLGGLSHEIERQAEARIKDRVTEFVDGAVQSFVQQVADHITAPEHAQAYAAFRVHLVDTLIDTELAVFAGEIDKLQPEALVATGAATARALARREGFEGEIAAALRAAIDASSGRSLGELLAEAGVREDWRIEAESQLATQARNLVASDAFRQWLEDIVKPA